MTSRQVLADPRRVLVLGVALCVYVLAGLVTPTMLLFIGSRVPGRSLDATGHSSSLFSVACDISLLLLFALPHSLLARPRVKVWLAGWLPKGLERSLYVAVASLSMLALMLLWRPLPRVLCRIEVPLFVDALHALYWAGIVVVYAATICLDHLHLLGLRQAWQIVADAPALPSPGLRVDGPYRWVRHPIMSGLLLVFWATPTLTLGRLLFGGSMTLYIVLGTWLEERDLVRVYGQAFVDYQTRTPMFVPAPWRRPRARSAISPQGRQPDTQRIARP